MLVRVVQYTVKSDGRLTPTNVAAVSSDLSDLLSERGGQRVENVSV